MEYKRLIRFSFLIKDINQREILLNAIEGKGAFQRFKYLIRKYNLLDSWHIYQREKDLELAIEFLNDKNIDYINDIV